MSKKTTIYLVRHGESESNKQRLVGGHVDTELTEQGKEQARKTRDALSHIKFDEAYSSDLKRAVDTAGIIYGKPVPEEHRLYGLRERSFGSFEGEPEHVLEEGNAQRHEMPHDEGWTFKHIHDMENDHELTARCLPVLAKIAEENPGKTILIASHGGVIRSTVMKLAGYIYQEMPAGSFANAGYAELSYTPEQGLRVMQINGVKL